MMTEPERRARIGAWLAPFKHSGKTPELTDVMGLLGDLAAADRNKAQHVASLPSFSNTREDSRLAPCPECFAVMQMQAALDAALPILQAALKCDGCGRNYLIEESTGQRMATMCEDCMKLVEANKQAAADRDMFAKKWEEDGPKLEAAAARVVHLTLQRHDAKVLLNDVHSLSDTLTYSGPWVALRGRIREWIVNVNKENA